MNIIVIENMKIRCECGRIIPADNLHIAHSDRAMCVQYAAFCWACAQTFILRNIKTTGSQGDGI